MTRPALSVTSPHQAYACGSGPSGFEGSPVPSPLPSHSLLSDEEDDVAGHHDLVVVLHAAEGGVHLGSGEGGLVIIVNGLLQCCQADGLSMSRAEGLQQSPLKCLQPGEGKRHLLLMAGRIRTPTHAEPTD